jgi:prepilin-type N-terminal cleavage/methylation domain-containing protein
MNNRQSAVKKTVHCPLSTGKTGFTLIETIMVMVIAVILAAVVAVRWSPFDTIKLNSATRKVAADIRYAQKVAISTQATYAAIAFNTNGYTVYDRYASVISRSPGDPCSDSGGNFIVAFNDSRCSNYSGVTVSAITLYFNSLGTPVDATGTAIVGNQTVTVTYNGARQITIEANTGRVSY